MLSERMDLSTGGHSGGGEARVVVALPNNFRLRKMWQRFVGSGSQ